MTAPMLTTSSTHSDCALFVRHPELARSLPRLVLGRFPTALQPLRGIPELERAGVELWVKREDLCSPLYGGNKVRKLELLLADPRLQTSPLATATDGTPQPRSEACVLSYGAYGSNHVLAMALHARALGLKSAAVLFPQPITPLVQQRLREQLGAGVQLFPCRTYLHAPWQRYQALQTARRAVDGHSPDLVELAPGGSSPLGTLGWVSGGLEIAAQVQAGEAPHFDAVYGALGSGGMIAGLWLGLQAAAKTLVAVRVVPWPVACRLTVQVLAARTQGLLQALLANPAQPPPPRPRLQIRGGFVGAGYGDPSAAAVEAVRWASEHGLNLEPTYTGKTLAALLSDVRAGRLRGQRVLFINSYNSADLSHLAAHGDLNQLPPWLQSRIALPRLP